jgi:hypothetical protein
MGALFITQPPKRQSPPPRKLQKKSTSCDVRVPKSEVEILEARIARIAKWRGLIPWEWARQGLSDDRERRLMTRLAKAKQKEMSEDVQQASEPHLYGRIYVYGGELPKRCQPSSIWDLRMSSQAQPEESPKGDKPDKIGPGVEATGNLVKERAPLKNPFHKTKAQGDVFYRGRPNASTNF